MDKAIMMQNFDQMNTARLKLDELLACALQAERTRDFRPVVDGYSVGLSSGTSGSRAVFVVSPAERAQWAGAMLARLLPRGLFAGERVALFLRANNNLYTSIRNPWVSFEFFDLLTPLEEHFKRLGRYAPTIVVGPAQVLRNLALAKQEGRIDVHPRKVISGAEVLESFDKALLKQVFGDVGEVYQATEGFLASTCPHGTLHLNEAHVHVEPQWIDATRFVPIITDFSRVTQPIVRYRLDDILVKDAAPCRCGSHEMALERIEGRCDDMLRLPGIGGQSIDVIADGISRAIAQTLPLAADYRLIQTADAALELYVDGPAAQMPLYRTHLNDYLQRQGVATSAIHWTLHASMPKAGIDTKRRRIVRRPALHTC
jgi:putative adenylate-forming enzyme